MVKRRTGFFVSVLVLLLTVAGAASANVASNYNAKWNPPHEYICDNDPSRTQCGWRITGGSGVVSSIHAWSGDYRWSSTASSATAYAEWQVTPENQNDGKSGRNWQVWAHIPHSEGVTATSVPYYKKSCSISSSCSYEPIMFVNQYAAQGTWLGLLNQQYIGYGQAFSIKLTNQTGNLTNGQRLIFDAIDFWDYTY